MGNKSTIPKPKIFIKEGIFITYMDMIKFIETEIIYQLIPEYPEIKEFNIMNRKLEIISENGFQKKINSENYNQLISNPEEIKLTYDNTLINDHIIIFRFAIRYPANIKMSLQDFTTKIKITKELLDNTEITFLEKIIIKL